MFVARPFSCPTMRRNVLTTARAAVAHPDQLTTSAPVLDRYCFTLNFGHATGASLHSHNVPTSDVSRCSKQRVKNAGPSLLDHPISARQQLVRDEALHRPKHRAECAG